MATTTAQRRNKLREPGLNITNDAVLLAKVQRIKELKTIERAAAAAETERKTIEAELREEMGDETRIVVRGQVIASLSSGAHYNTIVDRDKLKTAFPEAYQACVSKRHYQFVQVPNDATMEAILKSL